MFSLSPYRVFSVVMAALFWWGWPGLGITQEGSDLRSAVGVVAGADATMLGFLVSTGALIFAVGQTTLVRNLYRTGHMEKLLGALFSDAALFLLGLCISLACMVMPNVSEGLRVLMAVNVAAILLLLQVGNTMWHLLISMKPSGPLELP